MSVLKSRRSGVDLREVVELRAEVERLLAENKIYHDNQWRQLTEAQAEIERLRAENEQALAECARLNELFALKWDATQSAETEMVCAEIERLKAERAYIAETLYSELRADNARLREIILDALDEEVALRMMQKWCEEARAELDPKP